MKDKKVPSIHRMEGRMFWMERVSGSRVLRQEKKLSVLKESASQ